MKTGFNYLKHRIYVVITGSLLSFYYLSKFLHNKILSFIFILIVLYLWITQILKVSSFIFDFLLFNMLFLFFGISGKFYFIINIGFIVLSYSIFSRKTFYRIFSATSLYFFILNFLEFKGIIPIFGVFSKPVVFSESLVIIFIFWGAVYFFIKKKQEEILEKRLIEKIIFSARTLIIVFDVDKNIIYASKETEKLLGYKDLKEKLIEDIYSKEEEEEEEEEGIFTTREGEEIPVKVRKSRIKDEDGKIFAVVWVIEDLRERERIVFEKEKFENILTQMGDGILIFREKEGVVFANKKAEEFLGPNLIGKNRYEILGERASEIDFERIYRKKEIFSQMIDLDEKILIVTFSPVDLGEEEYRMAVMKDVTNFLSVRRELEEKIEELKKQRLAILNLAEDLKEKNEQLIKMQEILINQEKLASVGELAAGVAHELNNPLTTIMGMTDLIYSDSNITEEQRENLSAIKEEAIRMRGIISDMLAFSRREREEKTKIKLNEVIKKAEALLSTRIRHEMVKVDKDLGEIPEIDGNFDRLIQVFINLFNNSMDAFDKKEKKIFIKTYFDRKKEKIVVIFKDNGCGMDEATRKRIFDPFFTTKKTGTGLGMSIVYGILKNHNVDIFIVTEKGKGTEFRLSFPLKMKEKI